MPHIYAVPTTIRIKILRLKCHETYCATCKSVLPARCRLKRGRDEQIILCVSLAAAQVNNGNRMQFTHHDANNLAQRLTAN